MFPAFLTAIFFALSAVFATRSSRLLGYALANLARLWVSSIFLAAWAFTCGSGLRGNGLLLFILSGVAGFGLSDLAFFASLPLIGSRLASLMVQCLAAPFAALVEWLWLGTRLDALEITCGGLILAGVALAIAPSKKAEAAALHADPTGHVRGLLFGLLAALGQGGGAVLSRKAHALSAVGGLHVDGGTAAFQRILGGLVLISLALPLLRRNAALTQNLPLVPNWKAAWPWVAANCVAGATLGVSCYQWALATTPSAVVLPIVALTPLIVVPLALFLEGERPSLRSMIGAVLAVGAAAALARLR